MKQIAMGLLAWVGVSCLVGVLWVVACELVEASVRLRRRIAASRSMRRGSDARKVQRPVSVPAVPAVSNQRTRPQLDAFVSAGARGVAVSELRGGVPGVVRCVVLPFHPQDRHLVIGGSRQW